MSDNHFVLITAIAYAGTYLSVAFLGFHSRVLGQQLLPKVPDNHGSLAAGPSYFFSPEVTVKKFFVGNPIHESISICNSMIWSAIWELIARVRFVISRGEAE